MIKKSIPSIRIATALVLSLSCVNSWSQDNLQDQLELSKTTLDAGGGQSSSSQFILIGTVGQPDASKQSSSSPSLTGGTYLLAGGFWANVDTSSNNDNLIFKNGFEQE